MLAEALKDRPDDEDLLYQYGAVLDRDGDRKTAIEHHAEASWTRTRTTPTR